jgi:hypothetical protein
MTDTRDASLDEAVSLIDRAGEQAPKLLEKIFAAAQPGAVFGQPVTPEATRSSRPQR